MCSCTLRNIFGSNFSWTCLPTTDPLETVKETVFFKTVELAMSEGRSRLYFSSGCLAELYVIKDYYIH